MIGAFLVDLAVRSTVIALVALAIGRMMRRRQIAYEVAVLRAASLALLALPVAMALLPSMDIAMPVDPILNTSGETIATMPLASMPSDEPAAFLSPIATVGMIYAAGMAILLLRLVVGLWALHRWTRQAVPMSDQNWLASMERSAGGMRRRVRLRISKDVAAPLGWGLISPTILLDPHTAAHTGRADAVIAHECAHIARFDWPLLISSRIATALLWFNPLVWLIERTLSDGAETAADERAAKEIGAIDYAQTLVEVACGSRSGLPACAMSGRQSLLSKRVRHLLETPLPQPPRKAVGMALLVGGVLASAPIAATRLVATNPAPARADGDTLSRPTGQDRTSVAPGPTVIRDAQNAARREPYSPKGQPKPRTSPPTGSAPSGRRPQSSTVAQPKAPVIPFDIDRRQAAWELTEQARVKRAEARVLAGLPSSGVKVHDPPTVQSLRSEADRLDMAARRLLFAR